MSASVIFVQLASLSNKAGHLLASTFVYIAAERPLYLTRQENKRHPLETQESPWRNPRTGLNIRYMIETKSKNPPSCSLCREKHFLPLLSSFPLLRGGKREFPAAAATTFSCRPRSSTRDLCQTWLWLNLFILNGEKIAFFQLENICRQETHRCCIGKHSCRMRSNQ